MAAEATYIEKADVSIRETLLRFECQPILFVGSGLAQRYFGAPTWHALLKAMFEKLPDGADGYEYNRQKHSDEWHYIAPGKPQQNGLTKLSRFSSVI